VTDSPLDAVFRRRYADNRTDIIIDVETLFVLIVFDLSQHHNHAWRGRFPFSTF
jgi:hypothetical protein